MGAGASSSPQKDLDLPTAKALAADNNIPASVVEDAFSSSSTIPYNTALDLVNSYSHHPKSVTIDTTVKDDDSAPPAPTSSSTTPINKINAGMTPAPNNRKFFAGDNDGIIESDGAPPGSKVLSPENTKNAGFTPKPTTKKFFSAGEEDSQRLLHDSITVVGYHGDAIFGVAASAALELKNRGAITNVTIKRISDNKDAFTAFTSSDPRTAKWTGDSPQIYFDDDKSSAIGGAYINVDDYAEALWGFTFGCSVVAWEQESENTTAQIAEHISKQSGTHVGDPPGPPKTSPPFGDVVDDGAGDFS